MTVRANVSVPNVVIAALVLSALAACGGGGGISSPGGGAPPTAAPTPAGPPASLARITPMPGLPTVPPASAAFTAPPSTAPVAVSPRPSTAPVAAPTGSDLTGLLGGHPPQQYYAALAAPAAPYPLPASAPKGVLGTIAAFTADGFTIAVESPIDTSGAFANGASYAGGATAVGANAVTVHVSGGTADLVPGGFAALRVGDPVLAAGSGDPSSFTAALVAGESAARVAALRARTVRSASGVAMRRARDARRGTASKSAAVPTPSAGGSPTDLLIAASGANVAATFPNPPVAFESAFLGCVSVSLEPVATAGIGASASYPLQLADSSSDDDPYVESKIQKLPATLMNDYDAGGTRYTIEIALVASVRGVVTQNCAASLGALQRGVPYDIAVASEGTVLSAVSSDALPGSSEQVVIAPAQCPSLTFSNGAPGGALIGAGSVTVGFCEDFTLTGSQILAGASITNALIESAPVSTGLPAASWTWSSDLPDGDPNTTVLPLAESSGAVQNNTLTLQNVQYGASLNVRPYVTFAVGTASASRVDQPSYVTNSVFQQPAAAPPFASRVGVSVPSTAFLGLSPHVPTVGVIGK